MRRLVCCFTLLLALLGLALPAATASPVVSQNLSPLNTGINAAPLSSNPNMVLRTDGYQSLTVYAVHAHGAATAVNMNCVAGPTPQVAAPVAVANVAASGTITYAGATFSYPVTANATLRMLVAPLNDTLMTCTFSAGGTPTAQDLVTVYARLGGLP